MKNCLYCGKPIKNPRNKKFCGYECSGLYRQNYAVCPICGKKFKHSPSDVTTKTCGSEDCVREWRKTHAETSRENIKNAHDAVKTSPKTGHFETHHAAVEWRIVSPAGEEYRFKNLILWAEQHQEMLPVSPRTGERVQPGTFCREIQRLKSNWEKYTIFREDYHGWRVIKNWDD